MTKPSDMLCNCTHGFWMLQGSSGLWGVFSLIAVLLLISFCCHILCCVQKHFAAKGRKFLPRFRSSVSLKNREMEENPIYGNITYTHAQSEKQEVETPAKISPARDCYANLSLKAPKAPGGRVSPLASIQYSDVMVLCEEEEEEQKKQEDKDSCSSLSDLYASVDAEHIRNKKEQSEEPYANHI